MKLRPFSARAWSPEEGKNFVKCNVISMKFSHNNIYYYISYKNTIATNN